MAIAGGSVILNHVSATECPTPPVLGPAVSFDQNGNQTGQIANMLTISWKGSYQLGSTESFFASVPTAAPIYAAFAGGSPAGNGTAVAVHSIGVFWCGSTLSGSCQTPQLFDGNDQAEADLGFTYSPAALLPNANWQDFTADRTSSGVVLNQSMSALRAAFSKFPVMLSPQSSPVGIFFGGTPDHAINIVGNQILLDPNKQQESGLTAASSACVNFGLLCNWNSVVYYSVNMFGAQYASTNLYSPVYPPTTSSQQVALQQLLTAIGRGVGNTAAHEMGHQFRLPDIDCDRLGRPSCPGPGDSTLLYEYYAAEAPSFLDVGSPLKWDNNDTNALNQQLFKK